MMKGFPKRPKYRKASLFTPITKEIEDEKYSTKRKQNFNDVFLGQINLRDFQGLSVANFRDIRAIKNSNQFERFAGVPVIGDSMKDVGIFHGDILVVSLTKVFRQPNLYVWDTPNGRTAKFGRDELDDTVTLHNKNGWSQNWNWGEVKILGAVVRIERDLEVIR